MPIRIKLLLLLLCLALLPVLLIGLLFSVGVENMGREIVDQGRRSLVERDQAYLEEKIADIAALLATQVSLAEQIIRNQASAIEAVLATTPVAAATAYHLAEDFDAGRVESIRLPRYGPSVGNESEPVLPVSLEQSVFLLTGSAEPRVLEADIERLSGVTDTYRALYGTPGLRSLWHYTSLENGLHNCFPGHGSYPAGYDPRQRPWYRKAVAAGDLVWTRALVDAATGRLVVTGAMPVYGPGGGLAGVTALDLVIDELFQINASGSKPWLQHAQMMVLVRDGGRLKVIAKHYHQAAEKSWDEPLDAEYLVDFDHPSYQALGASKRGNPVALYQADYRQETALWAVTPIGADDSYLSVVFPLEELTLSAAKAARFINRQKREQLLTMGEVLVGVVAAVILIALLAAHRLTGPLRDIAATARAIAGGKLESRIQMRRKDEIGLLAADINTMAAAIEDLQKDQETAHLQMIRTLTRALEKKDSYTAAHSGRVAMYSMKLGERIGLDKETLELLKHGALTHDLGKIGVPDLILNKPAPLDADEAAIMGQHPEHTAKIMRPLVRFGGFAQIAAWHHERWDGKGYPDGLKGEEIPLLARIVAIADTWDAMTGDRVYRKGMGIDKALAILESEKNSGQWDPQLLLEFIAIIREESSGEAGVAPA